MESGWSSLISGKRNFIFLGEAGCGKTEAALNLSLYLSSRGKQVHFFDMDQTKPLFRARDVRKILEDEEICFHYEEQFADAPTQAGGVAVAMTDKESYTVMDVGGDKIGACLIGGYSHLLNRADTTVFYLLNPYRIWSRSPEYVRDMLISVTGAARVRSVQVLANPYIGKETTEKYFSEGLSKAREYVPKEYPVKGVLVREGLQKFAEHSSDLPVVTIRKYVQSEWNE